MSIKLRLHAVKDAVLQSVPTLHCEQQSKLLTVGGGRSGLWLKMLDRLGFGFAC